jgi:hypothetical protein
MPKVKKPLKLSASILAALHTTEEALALYGLRCVAFDIQGENRQMNEKGDGVSAVGLAGHTLDGQRIDAYTTVKKQATLTWKPVRVDFTVKPFGVMGVRDFTVNYMQGLDGDWNGFLVDDLSALRARALVMVAEVWEKYRGEMPENVKIFGALDPAQTQVLVWQDGAWNAGQQHHEVIFRLPPSTDAPFGSWGEIRVDCTGENGRGRGAVTFALERYKKVFQWDIMRGGWVESK